jgi:hypothetical protein
MQGGFMKLASSIIVLGAITVLIFGKASGQEIVNAPNVIMKYEGSNSANPQDQSSAQQQRVPSAEEQAIINEMKAMKATDDPVHRERFIELQKRLESINGREVTKPAEPYDGGLVPISEDDPQFSTITNVLVRSTGSSYVKGLATVTEQRGTTAGRIWLAIAFGQLANVRDSLFIYRSDNNGATWTAYALAFLGGTDKINFDDIDMEVVENTTGEKYLYVVYGIRADGGTGRWFAGGLVLQTPTFGGSLYAFSWPGDNPAKRYYRPRITSDNALYPSIPYLYIICSFDSLEGGSTRRNFQVYTRCLSPYTTAPTFTYMADKFWWHTATPTQRDLHSDIAYFQNGSDSVITVYSNVPDTNSLFFAKADIFGGPGGNVAAGGFIGGSNPNDPKQFARISSNSNTNGSVICVFRQFTGGNWNVKYFRTTNFGNFNTIADQSILLGTQADINFQPDIVGERNSSVHYLAFNSYSTSQDSVHYVKVTSAGGTTHVQRMNSVQFISGTQGAKPGIRHVSNDSCFVAYSASGPTNAWIAYGCTPPIVSVPGQERPFAYDLSQNYPNPFNPVTEIRYQLSEAVPVSIKVFDLLGQEVATLVNEVKPAGSYIVTWDANNAASGVYFYRLTAGGFTSVRKMVVLK